MRQRYRHLLTPIQPLFYFCWLKKQWMDTIRVLDKNFSVFISHDEIQSRIDQLAKKINEDYSTKKPILLSVLNGAFMFTSDLMKALTIDCQIEFIKMKSYDGMNSTGNVKTLFGLNDEFENRHIIVVEDIVDTGNTMEELLKQLENYNPAHVAVCSLLYKPEKFEKEFSVDYKAFSIPNDFVIGYGLDYNGYGRNYKDIYTVVE